MAGDLQVPTCTICGTEFDFGKRRTQESVDGEATKQGWVLGLPRQRAYCPVCDRLPIHRVGSGAS